MSIPILTTKLYIPPLRQNLIPRPHLVERLRTGLQGRLTLISAPAGFGKTTLVTEWFVTSTAPAAWLSLDEEDQDPNRFLTYLVAAIQTVVPTMGEAILKLLQSPQPPPPAMLLTTLLNELASLPNPLILVLDDYHLLDAQPVDHALPFLLDHLPPQLHLIITTREDPNLPLARLRASGQLTEIRAGDLRFTSAEAADFLNRALGVQLADEEIAALEDRTEGWIAGLQLAALSLQGSSAAGSEHRAAFIASFSGSHRFVMDYLVEEVLAQQPSEIQHFLLHTAILDRLSAPLCAAVLEEVTTSVQATLEYLEQANLFLVPLDSERRWYRYHHLFADLLRQRLQQQVDAQDREAPPLELARLHARASRWYEAHNFPLAAFHHAVAANDVARAGRLVAGNGMPLHFRGAITPVLNWLTSLPRAVLDTDPALWVTYASAVTMTGQPAARVEEKLQAAEALLPPFAAGDKMGDKGGDSALDPQTRDLVGHIAAIRAMLGIPQGQTALILTQSQRALAALHPHNLPVRTLANWTLGFAYQLQGNRSAAIQAYTDTIAVSQASDNVMATIAATVCLGQVQESNLAFALATEHYRQVLTLTGDPPWPTACEAYLGLARISYAWNELARAQAYAQQSLPLAEQLENIDTPASCRLLLARILYAQGDATGATDQLTKAEQFLRQQNSHHRMADVAAARAALLLRQGKVAAAAQLLPDAPPLLQARHKLAAGDAAGALTLLTPLHRQLAAREWPDELLEVMVVEAVALQADGTPEKAIELLGEALVMAEPPGLIRLFIDEGAPMQDLLRHAAARRILPSYTDTLLAAFEAPVQVGNAHHSTDNGVSPAVAQSSTAMQPLIEELSAREIEVLRLIAQGLSNREIGERLFIALDTVKGHNRKIFDKLQVQRRTEAVAQARKLGLLQK